MAGGALFVAESPTVAACGRLSEKGRFRVEECINAREHAIGHALLHEELDAVEKDVAAFT